MKRIVALLLALTLALGLSCLAEADASVVRLGDLTLSYADESGVRSVRFEGASLTLAIGEPEGMPTVQASFDNGNGQMVDGVRIELDVSAPALSAEDFVCRNCFCRDF